MNQPEQPVTPTPAPTEQPVLPAVDVSQVLETQPETAEAAREFSIKRFLGGLAVSTSVLAVGSEAAHHLVGTSKLSTAVIVGTATASGIAAGFKRR